MKPETPKRRWEKSAQRLAEKIQLLREERAIVLGEADKAELQPSRRLLYVRAQLLEDAIEKLKRQKAKAVNRMHEAEVPSLFQL